jgi:dipeptidase
VVPGGIGEEDMVTLVLPYISSAREGVLLLGSYLERYGTYEMNGIAFSDADEIWWLETVGGHHWIAARVPDDCYVTMPNQLGIDAFDLKDALGEGKDFLCSADLAEWMDAHHLDLTIGYEGDGPVGFAERSRRAADDDLVAGTRVHRLFNPREAFGSHSDADHVYNTPRAWDLHRFLNPRLGWGKPDANWGPEDDDIPWALPPARKVTIEDVKHALSLHYQGTPYDPYGSAGTPSTRGSYRPIGINRNGQLAVIQLRPYGPESCRALQWMAFGSNAFNALVPLYANVNRVPEYLSNTTAQVTTESFYWANRIIAGLADPHFGACAPHIERYQMAVGAKARAIISATDRELAAGAETDATEKLEAANQAIADMLRAETDKVLGHVLFESSMLMKNGFSRSDG